MYDWYKSLDDVSICVDCGIEFIKNHHKKKRCDECAYKTNGGY